MITENQTIEFTFNPCGLVPTSDQWLEPLEWHKNSRAFEHQHGRLPRVLCIGDVDVFGDEMDDDTRADLFNLIRKTPDLNWLLPTAHIRNAPVNLDDCTIHGELPSNVTIGVIVADQDAADADIPKLLSEFSEDEQERCVLITSTKPVSISRWIDPTGVTCADSCSDTRYVLDHEVATSVVRGNETEPICPHCGSLGSWTGYDPGIGLVLIAAGAAFSANQPEGVTAECARGGVPVLYVDVPTATAPAAWLPMESAPKDGSLIDVKFDVRTAEEGMVKFYAPEVDRLGPDAAIIRNVGYANRGFRSAIDAASAADLAQHGGADGTLGLPSVGGVTLIAWRPATGYICPD